MSNHNHCEDSNFRLKDSVIKAEDIVNYAIKMGYNGVSITDHETLSAHIRILIRYKYLKNLYKKYKENNTELSESDLKEIETEKELLDMMSENFKLGLGNEIYLIDDLEDVTENYERGVTKFYHFILIAKNLKGHEQLRAISSYSAWANYFRHGKMERVPTVKSELEEIIGEEKGNLVATTACLGGEFPQYVLEHAYNPEDLLIKKKINRFLKWGIKVFGKENFFVELQPCLKEYSQESLTDNHEQIIFNKTAVKIAKAYGLNWTVATDSHYLKKEHRKAVHEAYLHSDEENSFARELGDFYETTYMMSIEEIVSALSSHLSDKDIIEAFKGSMKIYEMIEDYELHQDVIVPRDKNIPEFKINGLFEEYYSSCPYIKKFAESEDIQERYFLYKCEEGFLKKNQILNEENVKRINVEMEEIWEASARINMRIAPYYILVEVLVNKIMWNISYVGVARGCFVPDSKILLGDHTVKNIQNIKIGDEVVTHKCNIKKVTNVLEYDVNEEMSIIRTGELNDIVCTKDHELFALKTFKCEAPSSKRSCCTETCKRRKTCKYRKDSVLKWTKASELVKNDYLTYPKIKIENAKIFTIDLKELDPKLKFDEKHVWYETCAKTTTEKINRFIRFDKEFARLAGYYIGNGYAEKSEEKYYYRFEISFNSKSKESIDDCVDLVKGIFGIENINLYNNKKGTCVKVTKNIKILGLLFKSYFSNSALTKKIPNELIVDNKEVITNLVLGMIRTDGSVDSKENRFKYSTTSINLHYQLKWLMSYLGFYMSGSRRTHKTNNWNDEFSGRISGAQYLRFAQLFNLDANTNKNFYRNDFLEDENYFYARVYGTSKKNYRGKVYDLSVTDDISYNVNGFNVHNSVTGFYTAYLMDITQMNPIKYNLPHWRHLSATRPELPDVDLDTEASKRHKIFDAMKDYYGFDNVLNILTLKTEGSKSTCLTMCRGFDIDNDTAQAMADLIPFERGKNWSISDCLNGNKKKGRPPITEFKREVEKYEGLKEAMLLTEGLVCGRSIHASGVYVFENGFLAQNSRMRAPNGSFTTAWTMKDSDYCGGLKVDCLTIQALDKMHINMDLLEQFNVIEPESTLKETYNKYIHPDVLEYENKEMWKLIGENTLIDAFQFDTEVGADASRKVKPESLEETAVANSLMRLMGDGTGEQPLDTYIKYKNNISLWYQELREFGLNESQIKIAERHLLPVYGVADTQEVVMEIVMDKEISAFTIPEANKLRKAIAKKDPKVLEQVKELFYKKAKEVNEDGLLAKYFWEVQIKRQLGYSFSKNHTIPYSCICVQEMNLAHRFGKIFWNTACLTVNSGADENSDNKKNTNYGKVAKAIGEIQSRGQKVALPDINKAQFGFLPDLEKQEIIFGVKGICGVGDDSASAVIDNRPYTSLEHFIEKMEEYKNKEEDSKFGNSTIASLIKAGSFDKLEGKERSQIMYDFCDRTAEKAKKLTTTHIPLIMKLGILTKEQKEYEYRLFRFRKYLYQRKFFYKKVGKSNSTEYYFLDEELALPFFYQYFETHMTEGKDYEYAQNSDGIMQIAVKRGSLDRVYKNLTKDFTEQVINNQEVLDLVNKSKVDELFKKYGDGTLSKWEMDSLSFYYGEHELAHIDTERYIITNFFDLPKLPKIAETYFYRGRERKRFALYRIAGTVLDTDKNKNTITLLTVEGVVTIKYQKGQFGFYNKQISSYDENLGKNKVLEKSWFKRGNKLLVTGYRRDERFFPTKYSDSAFKHTTQLITEVREDGTLKLQSERINLDEL